LTKTFHWCSFVV